MALTLPSRTLASKRSSARLDVLRLTLHEKPNDDHVTIRTIDSPRDSLSPFGEQERDGCRTSESDTNGVDLSSSPDGIGEAHFNTGSDSSPASPEDHSNEATGEEPRSCVPTSTCPPRCLTRSRRPKSLSVEESNGLTTASVAELKQQIRDGRTGQCDTRTQVPRRRRKRRLPKTPIREIAKAMGNTHSNTSSPVPYNASVRHHSTKNPVRVPCKSSTNLLHRAESKAPLPPAVSSTVIEVRRQVSPPVPDDISQRNVDSRLDTFTDGAKGQALSPAESTLTRTENGKQPLSAATTIHESRSETRADSRHESHLDTSLGSDENMIPLPASRPVFQANHRPLRISPAPGQSSRDSALSPTIPAPSPLPEDSPHKYGLKDRMDTPEAVEPEGINVAKARRRSSGLEIFNEAKSLQSASSFLNGLSTSRRRAESLQRSTETSAWTLASYDTQRPGSARFSRPPSRPSSALPANGYSADRRRGHNFKPSGFAYTRPLTHVQVKCFKQHKRLLPSRNKVAPVECSVCHIDDDRDHYSCSWCAIRMCRYCRRDFAERGITALRERIKSAEFGASGDSTNSSAESLGLMRGRSSFL